jgi:hypothetical protein
MTFDRALPEPFLALLAPDGPLHPLVCLARDSVPEDALDLHLRKKHVTLYVGTTKAFDLHYYARGSKVQLHPFRSQGGVYADVLNGKWDSPQDPHALANDWQRIEMFVNAFVSRAREAGRHMKEGVAQAEISKTSGLTLVDREFKLSFAHTPAREAILNDIHAPFAAAVRAIDEPWARAAQTGLANGRRAFGDKIDALFVDPSGRLVVMEVKLQDDTGKAGWTPAQVGFYAALLQRWILDDPRAARESLMSVVRQRASLGLAYDAPHHLAEKIEVVQVILLAEGNRANLKTVTSRMRRVADALADVGKAAPGLVALRPGGEKILF